MHSYKFPSHFMEYLTWHNKDVMKKCKINDKTNYL